MKLVDTDRTSYRVFQGLRMVVHSILLALPGVVARVFIVAQGWQMSNESADAYANHIGPFTAIGHLFIITNIMTMQWNKESALAATCPHDGKAGDEAEFMRLTKRMSVPLNYRMAVFCTAFVTELIIVFLHFASFRAGVMGAFTGAFMLAVLWEWVADTENPFGGVSVTVIPPPEWKEKALQEGHVRRRLSDRVYGWIYVKLFDGKI